MMRRINPVKGCRKVRKRGGKVQWIRCFIRDYKDRNVVLRIMVILTIEEISLRAVIPEMGIREKKIFEVK